MSQRAAGGIAEHLAAFVPDLLVHRFSKDREPARPVPNDRYSVVVLFADISGSTSVVARLSDEHPDKPEAVAAYLNRFFTPMIDEVAAAGGDVIKFAGDAFIAVWRREEGALGDLVSRVAGTGLALQQHAERFSHERPRLRLKVAVAEGVIEELHLGGLRDRWELVLWGEPFEQISAVEQHARAGDVLVSAEAWKLIKEHCQGKVLNGGSVKILTAPPPLVRPAQPLRIPSTLERPLSGYVPQVMIPLLFEGAPHWLGERRQLSVLFVQIPGLTREPRRAHAAITDAQKVLYAHEGELSKLNIDNKAITLICALGLYPSAHDDDPERAVRVAFAVTEALQTHQLVPYIGIATGTLFCGPLGSPRRREYTMVGPAMNLAARLMTLARDSSTTNVLCDTATAQRCQGSVVFDEPVKLDVRSFGELQCYAPLSWQGQATDTLRAVVGRDAELRLVSRTLTRLADRDAAEVILVRGEAGSGKTSLLDRVAELAGEHGVSCFRAAAGELESLDYQIWAPIFAQLFGIAAIDAANLEALRRYVRAQLPRGCQRRAALLEPVLPLQWSQTAATRELHGEERAAATGQLLSTVIEGALAGRPTAIIVDDAQWMDDHSMHLLRAVATAATPLAIIVALTASQDRHDREAALTALPRVRLLELAALSRAGAAELAAEELAADRIHDRLLDFLMERSGGHPLYALEIVRSLRDGEQVRLDEDGTARLRDASTVASRVDYPDTLAGLIMSRYDRLPARAKILLRIASVFMRDFSAAALVQAYPPDLSTANVEEDLALLEGLGFIEQFRAAQGATRFRYVHALTQHLIHDATPAHVVAPVHQRVATHIESTERNQRRFVRELAYHWERAGNTAKALQYLRAAGTAASGEEALEFLSRGRQIDTRRRGDWERELGFASYELGRLAESEQALCSALAHLGHAVPDSPRALRIATRTLLARRRVNGGMRRRAQRDAHPASTRKAMEAATALQLLSNIAYRRNDLARLRYYALRSAELADASGDPRLLAPARAGLALAAAVAGDVRRSRRELRIADGQRVRLHGKQLADARVLHVKALLATGNAEWDIARHAALEAAHRYEALSQPRLADEAMAAAAFADHSHGELAPKLARSFEDLHRSAATRSDRNGMLLAQAGRALVAFRSWRRREPAQLLDMLAEWRALGGDGMAEPFCLLALHALRARAHLFAGNLERAADEVQVALGRIRHSPPLPYYALDAVDYVAEVALCLWEMHAAGTVPAMGAVARATAGGAPGWSGRSGSFGTGRRGAPGNGEQPAPSGGGGSRQAGAVGAVGAAGAADPATRRRNRRLRRESGGIGTLAARIGWRVGARHAALPAQAQEASRALSRFAARYPFAVPRARLRRGTVAWLAERPRVATAEWLEARRQADRLSMPFDRALAQLELGRVAAFGSEVAEATDELRRLGLVRGARQAQRGA